MRRPDFVVAYCSMPRVRRVWAYVTLHQQATVREIARELAYSLSSTQAALRFLQGAGYITSIQTARRTRIVVVPFYVQQQ